MTPNGAGGKPGGDVQDDQQMLRKKARDDQDDFDLIMRVGSDEVADMAKLQTIADRCHEVADLWEANGDMQMAQQARDQEQQARNLMERLAVLEGQASDEQQVLLDEIRNLLRRAAGQRK